MLPDLPDPRGLTAISSLVVLGLVLVVGLLLRRARANLTYPSVARLTIYALLILAVLRVYAATSFMWAEYIEVWLLDVLRYVSLALTTVAGILLLTVTAYFIRKR